MATWTHSGVLWFPTLVDFQASNMQAGILFTKDSNGVVAGFALDLANDETGTEGIDWIKNASNVHYRRRDIAAP